MQEELLHVDANDGEFFMAFEDWYAHFSHLFAAVDFGALQSKQVPKDAAAQATDPTDQSQAPAAASQALTASVSGAGAENVGGERRWFSAMVNEALGGPRWCGEGGGHRMGTAWAANPKLRLRWIDEEEDDDDENEDDDDDDAGAQGGGGGGDDVVEVYIRVSVPDARLTDGMDFWKAPLQQVRREQLTRGGR